MRSLRSTLVVSVFVVTAGCGGSGYIPIDPEGVIVSDRAIDMCQGSSYGELQVLLETIMAAKDMGMTRAEWVAELSSTSPLSDMPCYFALLDQVYTDDSSSPGQQDGEDDAPPPLTVTATSPSTAVPGGSITCSASAHGGQGTISFTWQITALGPAGSVTITGDNSQTAVVTFSADAAGTFSFQVTATDTAGQRASAPVSVVVQ